MEERGVSVQRNSSNMITSSIPLQNRDILWCVFIVQDALLELIDTLRFYNHSPLQMPFVVGFLWSMDKIQEAAARIEPGTDSGENNVTSWSILQEYLQIEFRDLLSKRYVVNEGWILGIRHAAKREPSEAEVEDYKRRILNGIKGLDEDIKTKLKPLITLEIKQYSL